MIHNLDDRLRPVPDGIVGETYGAGAQGYFDRTGDLACWSGDAIEHFGRADG